MSATISRLRTLWRNDPKGMSLDLLRVGVGLIWAVNLIFILAPSNRYFAGFQSVAAGFGTTTLGGPGIANFVAAHSAVFSWGIALLTGYLAFAFVAGFTTRLACFVGEIASALFLITQFGATFVLNGAGTDVGAHPLYLLIYLILFVGGAGQYVAIDHWIWKTGRARLPRLSQWLASPNLVGPTAHDLESRSPASPRWGHVARPAMSEQQFFNTLAVIAVLVVLGCFGAAYAGSAAAPSAPAATTGSGSPTSYMYLTIVINPNTGMPQYSPSNFTVPAGTVVFTIVDQDAAVNWSACQCNVSGTVGGTETLNGTALSEVNASNAAHTFSIPSLGVNVISPGNSTITFTLDLNQTGPFSWYCEAPCGSAGYMGAPMGVPGYMTGTMDVV
jgi:hypothetical protein